MVRSVNTFFSSSDRQDRLRGPLSLSGGNGRQGDETDRSPPTTAEIRMRGAIHQPPTTCLHDIHRDFIKLVLMLFISSSMDVPTSLRIYAAVNVRLNTQGILEYWSSYLISGRSSVPSLPRFQPSRLRFTRFSHSLPSSPPPIHHTNHLNNRHYIHETKCQMPSLV